jgi:hypothetical protein
MIQIGWFDMPENASGVLTTRLATDAVMVGLSSYLNITN